LHLVFDPASSRKSAALQGGESVDWKLLSSTFFAILLAEMGDKTQLATMSLSAGRDARWTVFAAAALALVTSTLIAVLAGDLVARYIPPIWIKRVAGTMFVLLGVSMLLSRTDA
jgi:putative Ca2+/H+ antiporter (TMEM165/GDT1 family)